MKKALIVVFSILALLLLLVVIGLLWFDWNKLKDPITDLINERSGRTIEIHGDIDVDVSMTPVITIEGIELGNASWAQADNMLELERLRFSIRLWELLKGRVELPRLELYQPRLELERNGEGKGNWVFDEGVMADASVPDHRGSFPVIGSLHIEDGKLHFIDATRDFELDGRLATVNGEGGTDDDSVELQASGELQGRALELKLTAGSLVDLRDEEEMYPVALAITIGDTEVAIEGELDRPLKLRGLDLELRAGGPDLSALYELSGIPFPGSPPYEVSGQLQHRGSRWSLQSLQGRIGDSDIGGKLAVDTAGERLQVKGELHAEKLDFDDLGPLIGAPPGTGRGETESAAQEAQAEKLQRRGDVIPEKQLDLSAIREADAEIRFSAAQIIAPKLPLQDLRVALSLKSGVMDLDPLQFGLAGGTLDGDIRLDATGDQIVWHYDIALESLKIGELVDTSTVEELARGTITGQIQIESRGNSMHETAANSDGRIKVSVAGGRLSNLMIELIGLDVAESLGLLLSDGEQSIPFSCAIGELTVAQGKLRSQILVIDTEDTRIDAELTADLETEEYELILKPQPKDPSLLAARTPLTVEGSFREVNVGADMGSLGLRAGAAALLGTVATPAAALLAFIEPGTGTDADCEQLQAEVRTDISETERDTGTDGG